MTGARFGSHLSEGAMLGIFGKKYRSDQIQNAGCISPPSA
jgi:hypothetical protein